MMPRSMTIAGSLAAPRFGGDACYIRAPMSTGQADGQAVGDDRLESSVGQYRIVRRIGQGGMGVVYEAVHRAIGQRAAIKVLAAGTRRANYFERFANEARAASAVAHPGLVKVFDFGKLSDGTPYILMEYLEGELLRTRMERLKKLPLEMVVQIIRQIASALSAVHAGGIVHRDVKPENVIIVADDVSEAGERPKLLDFGVARVDSGSSSMLTDPGMVVGTPVYMSPEQCCGGTVDWASDVYSLGVMACEMLCGKLPHAAQGPAVMQAHVDEEPRPHLLEGVPEPIAALVFRMLAKQSWHRPTAAVVANDLHKPNNRTKPIVFPPTLKGIPPHAK
jgi:serine/threonine-protein kinase